MRLIDPVAQGETHPMYKAFEDGCDALKARLETMIFMV